MQQIVVSQFSVKLVKLVQQDVRFLDQNAPNLISAGEGRGGREERKGRRDRGMGT